MNRDPVWALAENIVQTKYEDIPQDAIEGSKRGILDALGATIAGSTAPGVQPTLALLEEWGGKQESSVAIFGNKLPAFHAVLANVLMSHALEIDDSHFPGIVHPTSPTLWSALAIAEIRPGTTGQELLTAIILGIDTMVRIGLSAPKTLDNGYHTAIYSGFGAAVTAGKLLGLDSHSMVHALGITFAQAAASVQAGADGALVKRLQPCFNASAGLKAVKFAQAGITGIQNVFEGRSGIGRLLNHAPIDNAKLLDRLGAYFFSSELTTKLYPTSGCAHAPIVGTVDLVKTHNIHPEDIEEVIVAVQTSCFKRESAPFEPEEGTAQVKAQFCIDYCVAAAIIWRDVYLEQICDAAIFDQRVPNLVKKIKIVENTQNIGPTPYLPARITIRARGGKTFSKEVTRLRGYPSDPLGWEEILNEKFERCLKFSAFPVSKEQGSKIVNTARRVEELADARELLNTIILN